jgi:hypothetical protein
MDFEQWMRKVDSVLLRRIGVTSGDCRDRLWRDHFEDELTPEEAVECEFGDLDNPEAMMMEELFG